MVLPTTMCATQEALNVLGTDASDVATGVVCTGKDGVETVLGVG